MIAAQVYKGIEFIQVADLPKEQQATIKKWASRRQIIKILKDDTLLTDCIQFKDYRYWVENILHMQEVITLSKPSSETAPLELAFAH